jgi:hypothetical protein
MRSASSSSSSSGCAAIPRPAPSKTSSRKSTTAASLTPTSITLRGIPGWKTDRGRIYITYGPPDEIDDPTPPAALRAASRRGRRRNLHLPLRTVALPLHRRRRHQRHYRVRRPHHDGRVSHDHGPVRERTRCGTSAHRSHPPANPAPRRNTQSGTETCSESGSGKMPASTEAIPSCRTGRSAFHYWDQFTPQA